MTATLGPLDLLVRNLMIAAGRAAGDRDKPSHARPPRALARPAWWG